MDRIIRYIRSKRKLAELTQRELSERSGLGLRFIRELEQGKATVRLDKLMELLKFLGGSLVPMDARDLKTMDENQNERDQKS